MWYIKLTHYNRQIMDKLSNSESTRNIMTEAFQPSFSCCSHLLHKASQEVTTLSYMARVCRSLRVGIVSLSENTVLTPPCTGRDTIFACPSPGLAYQRSSLVPGLRLQGSRRPLAAEVRGLLQGGETEAGVCL